jgi:hypothetical protein
MYTMDDKKTRQNWALNTSASKKHRGPISLLTAWQKRKVGGTIKK